VRRREEWRRRRWRRDNRKDATVKAELN